MAGVSYTGGTYAQNFDNLFATVPTDNTATAATVLPTGWTFTESGANANTNLRVHKGTVTAGDTILFGDTGSNERAFGSFASASLTSVFGLEIINNTASTLTQFTLNYKGEQWKDGRSASSVQNITAFAYGIGNTSLISGIFTPVTNLNLVGPGGVQTGSDITLDGNLPANQTSPTATVTGISWAPGQSLWLRWSDANDTGNDDGLAIDDVTFSTNPGQPDLNVGTSTPSPLTVGTPFNYTLDIQNNGTANASGIELTFTLPANVTYNSSNVLGGGFGSPTVSGSTLTFTGGSINASNFAQIQVNVTPTVAGALGSGTLVADPNNNITESNEGNNSIATATPTVNPAPGVTITQSGGNTNVTEGGATDSYTIVLNTQPTANVNIAINSGTQTTANPTNITFTTANWNAPQTVTVTAIDDAAVEGNHTQSISHTATSTDSNYNNIVIPNLTANITDNDNAGVTITQSGGSTDVTEGGATDSYTVVLNTQPTANVNIAINSGTQTTANPTNITFTTANWNAPQTVTVTAIDDAAVEGNHTQAISHTATSTDTNYNGITIASVTANITDNDSANTAPTISENSTTPFLNLAATGTGFVSGVINDPTDPARILGIDFTVADAETANPTVSILSSSNTSVVPLANLNLTNTGNNYNLKITPASVGYSDITVRVSDGSATADYIVKYAASAASVNPASTRFLTGASDASTAIAIDANYMLVADDEDQKIRLYDRTNSGLPLNSFNFTPTNGAGDPPLGLTQVSGGVPREVDIEASTKMGNRIFWLGSHSNASSGNSRPNRYRLFATDISGTGASTTINYVGRYDNLRTDLIAWGDANGYGFSNSAANGVIPELPNGFNIEGLTIAPNGTTGYVAFRAPNVPTATRNRALIAPITNFADLVTGAAASANIGAPIELDLGGRGIRSIEKNATNQYLIVAGSAGVATGTAPNDFRLYSWTGNPSDAPQLLLTDLTGLNADGSFESIVEVPNSVTNGTQVQLLVDNGDSIFYNDGTIAKDLTQDNFQKFRSEIITISTPKKVSEIQGNGATSPLVGTTQTIEGIVVGDFQTPTATEGLGGFFLQEETTDEDGNPLTSEGIFVFADSSLIDVNEGQKVRVTGTISETFGQTQITPANAAAIQVQNGGSLTQITPATVNLPFTSTIFAEQYEGMRVQLPQNLTVSDTFNLVRFGEITLSNGRLFQPTNIVSPGAAATAQQTENDRNQIILDDGRNGSYQTPFPYNFNASNPVRTGQTTSNVEGVLSYGFNNYRIHPTVTPTFTGNPRTNAPDAVGGTLKVTSFNLLNYFNGASFPTSRGASSASEFTRQRNKTIDAIIKMNADIIGVMELENDGYGSGSAIQDLINGLNSSPNRPAGVTYSFINPGLSQLGADEITVGLIYNSTKVSPVGNAAILTTAAFDQGANRLHRPPLAQTFQDITSGGKFTTVVNHFKSKGSEPAAGDPNADRNDGQGAWNLARTQAANDLTNWLATDPTNSRDSDFLIVGDLNSYAKEDPITAIRNRGYSNLIENFVGANGYSFVFQSQSGYLDHALSSNSLTPQVTGATEWHINADESRLIDYNEENLPNGGPAKPADFYNADPYRSSDHDPVVLGVNLEPTLVTIDAIDPNASETNSDVGTFRISRSGGGSVGNLNVNYTVTGQTISNDYNPSLTGTATIAANQSFVDVTIATVDDSLAEGNETLTLNLVDTADYNLGASNTATVNIADNDTAGVTISKSNTNVTEGGATDNYTVVLTSQPTNIVQVNVTPSNNQINLGAGAGNPLSLNFTPNTWNLPQTVTVTAIDDTQVEGNHTSNISHSASSSDSNYNINLANVAVNIADNDTEPLNLSLTVNPNSFAEGAGAIAATATITRTGSTVSQLTVNLASSDTSEATVPNSVIIPVGQTAANFAVAAVEDNIVDGSQTATITATANGFTNATTNLTVTDNDVAGVTIIQPPNGLNLVEGGAISGYSLVLNSQPTADVAISFDTGNQIHPIANINFTPNNWNIPQSIAVVAVDDTQVEGNHAGTISHQSISNDANYNGLQILSTVALITDNDTTEPDDCCGCDELEQLVNNSYNGPIPASNPPNDVIFGDNNPNFLMGGIGDDTIFGQSGNDLIFGNQNRDVINGNKGNDTIYAGKDDDFVRGGQNDDLISGDLGNDTVCGDLGNDTVLGMLGDDILLGFEGDDILNGNQGNDTVCGGEGNDLVRGGQDNDLVSGGSGNDTLYGDIGNDTICGCEGNDLLTGGKGSDIFVLKQGGGSDTIADFVVGQDLMKLSNISFSNLTITQGSGNQAADTLIRVTATNELLASLTGVTASSITESAIAFISLAN